MIDGLSELIESHSDQEHTLKNIEILLKKFNNVKLPSTLQYMKFISELNGIMDIDNE